MTDSAPAPSAAAASTAAPSAVRVRFAPSPTGYLHVGGARTALFNWLYARHTGGKFLLRIEDTDTERSTAESTQLIFESLEWLGLRPDEEPVYQSRRAEIYSQYLTRLLASGAAYYDYCPKERLDELRAQAEAARRPFVYREALFPPAEQEAAKAAGAAAVIRMRVPDAPGGKVGYDDAVYGRIEMAYATIGDFVIARGDGSPLYNFCNAVDDIDTGITHVCRGEDHVSNTARQILIYEALGAPVPTFAHLPLILGTDRKRFSKRHGATSVMQYRDAGILPEALLNFLSLLGWAPSEAEFEEVMDLPTIAAKFTLEKVNKAGAVFDMEKLHWMNGMYIRRQPKAAIYERVVPLLAERFGFQEAGKRRHAEIDNGPWVRAVIDLEIERSRTWSDFATNLDYFFEAPKNYDEKGVKKFLENPEKSAVLADCLPVFEEAWAAAAAAHGTGSLPHAERGHAMEAHLRAWADGRGTKFGDVLQPFRLALTGRLASPPFFDMALLLGKNECVDRVRAALQKHPAQS